MFKKLTTQAITHLFFVLIFFMLLSTVASTDLVVNPDGSATIENLSRSNVYVGNNQSSHVAAVSQDSITVDFNDLASGQSVSPDRYITLGLRIDIGPSSTTSGVIVGSVIDGPCDGTRSIKTEPFTGPSFLLRFPDGVTSVSLDAGDTGPSDSDLIIVKAFSDDALATLIGIDMGFLPEGAPTGCVRLSIQAPLIKAVEITSESYFLGSSFYPNSIFVDNVTFAPAL